MQYKLGFIGCGNMGGALLAAAAKVLEKGRIAAYDPNAEKLAFMQNEYGVVPLESSDLVRACDFVVLAVKPQIMEEVLAPLAEELRLRKDVTIISMAAGISVAGVRSFIGKDLPVIRIMPNTPVAVEEGMILYAHSGVREEGVKDFLSCFSKAGKFDPIPEEKIDAGSALSGCGPAFVYAFAEALADGAVECGVSREAAALYAAQTLKGAAEMLLTYGHPADLKDAVCSPGGTTIAGIHALESAGFRGAVMEAVTAAYKRTLELKK